MSGRFPNLEATLKSVIVPRLALCGMRGTLKLVIDGDDGGTFFLRLAGRTELTTKPCKPDCILRASRGDFEALVGGRMSLADGMLTDRIEVAGDLTMLTRLGGLVEAKVDT